MFKLCFVGLLFVVDVNFVTCARLQTSKSYMISVILAEGAPEYEYCGTVSAAFGGTDFGEVKFSTGKLTPGVKFQSQVMFAKQFIDFDPAKVAEVKVSWNSDSFMAFSNTCKPDNVTNEGKSINVVGVDMDPRGMFKRPREGNNQFTAVKHGESVVFKL